METPEFDRFGDEFFGRRNKKKIAKRILEIDASLAQLEAEGCLSRPCQKDLLERRLHHADEPYDKYTCPRVELCDERYRLVGTYIDHPTRLCYVKANVKCLFRISLNFSFAVEGMRKEFRIFNSSRYLAILLYVYQGQMLSHPTGQWFRRQLCFL